MARKKKNEIIPIENNDNILIDKRIDETRIKEDLKEELENYIDDKINKTFIDELDKTNRKLLREKSRKIIWKNIFIIILLAIIGFLLYLLFSNNYFDKYFNKTSTVVEEKKDDKKEEDKPTASPTPTPSPTPSPSPTPKIPTLDELKKEYGSLIDNYYVTDSSSYLTDFYDGNLSDNLKKYMTLNTMDFDDLKKEEDYQIIDDEDFKEAYKKLFSDTYESASFDYDDIKIRYVSKMEAYMTSEILTKEENSIEREIIDIKVNDNSTITITTIEGIVKNNKLYEILHNTEIEDYKGDNISKYQDKLNKVIYTFKDNKLIKLEK